MNAIRRTALATILILLLGAPVATAAATHAQTAAGSFVGIVHGTRAFVAIAVHGSHVTGYACDSKKIAQWFSGTVQSGKSTLTSKGGYVLRVTIAHGQASGTLTFPGHRGAVHDFAAAAANKPAGLYRGVKHAGGKRYLGGWIILPDGRQRGEVISGATDVASPALDPNNPTVQIKRGKKKPLIVIIAILIG